MKFPNLFSEQPISKMLFPVVMISMVRPRAALLIKPKQPRLFALNNYLKNMIPFDPAVSSEIKKIVSYRNRNSAELQRMLNVSEFTSLNILKVDRFRHCNLI